MRLYKALILPIALYSCETWTLKQEEENKLLVFEKAAFQKILRVRLLDKIRNVNIRSRVGLDPSDTILRTVFERQHTWLGHVLRTDNSRIARTFLQGRAEVTRKRDKPRTKWLQTAQ